MCSSMEELARLFELWVIIFPSTHFYTCSSHMQSLLLNIYSLVCSVIPICRGTIYVVH